MDTHNDHFVLLHVMLVFLVLPTLEKALALVYGHNGF